MNTDKATKTDGNLPICSVIARFIKRSKTNENELVKQYFVLIGSEGKDTALAIRKYVLINSRFDIYEKYGFQLLKEFKGYRLYRQVFSIKIDTLNDVVGWLNGL